MSDAISIDEYKRKKEVDEELERGCDFFAVLDHITGKARNDKAVEEFKEMYLEMKRTKPIRDEIRKSIFPDT